MTLVKAPKTARHNEDIETKFGRLEDKKYICVMDLELTCWADDDPDRRPRKEMEITEIGFEVLDAITLKGVSRITKCVKPLNHPTISKYNTELTGITQDEVDSSNLLWFTVQVMLAEGQIPDPKEFVWASWSKDPEWLNKELTAQGYPDIFDPRYIDVKILDNAKNKRRTLRKALYSLGLPQEMPAHRALPDAVSTARILRHMKLSALDAGISNSRTYRQALSSERKKAADKLSKSFSHLDDKSAYTLLKYCKWDYTVARNVATLFKN